MEYRIEIRDGKKERILLAEDEAAVREMMKTTLEMHGYQVLTASNGIEAITLYTQYQGDIHLALINTMMPTIDGLTTICILRTINPQLKIVATSGLTTPEQLSKMDIQVNDFLLKPFTSEELLTMLHQLLNS